MAFLIFSRMGVKEFCQSLGQCRRLINQSFGSIEKCVKNNTYFVIYFCIELKLRYKTFTQKFICVDIYRKITFIHISYHLLVIK